MTFDKFTDAVVRRMAETPWQVSMVPRDDGDDRLLFDMTGLVRHTLRAAIEVSKEADDD